MMVRPLRRAQITATVLALVAVGVLALAAPALAANHRYLKPASPGVAPPGNSGVSQYVEDLPTLSGGKPTHSVAVAPVTSGGSGGSSGPSTGSGGTGGSSIPAPVSKALSKHGKAGKAAAALAAGTAVASNVSAREHAANVVSASPTSQVLNTLGGSPGGGGLGSLLPVILIISLLVISGIGIIRRRGAA